MAGIVVVVAGAHAMSQPVGALADDDRATKLDERVQTLERAVLRDPFKPQNTVLARLEFLERQFIERDKSADKSAASDQRTLEEMRKVIEKNQRVTDELARSVKSLEQGGGGAARNELQQLRRDVERSARSLNDLTERVRRLEAKK